MTKPLVLVVEDRPMNAKLLRDVLVASGYDVAEAVDAETGLAIARERAPALVLMDIQLPGMDGMAAVRELKRDPRTAKIPVVAVTASAMPLERDAILRAGFDGYQAKPISVKDLLGEVRRLVAHEA
ncbi:MAG TPA: response regulator [Myxococcota bacterium]|nr:response regulator [Myxococcota bacterium]